MSSQRSLTGDAFYENLMTAMTERLYRKESYGQLKEYLEENRMEGTVEIRKAWEEELLMIYWEIVSIDRYLLKEL